MNEKIRRTAHGTTDRSMKEGDRQIWRFMAEGDLTIVQENFKGRSNK